MDIINDGISLNDALKDSEAYCNLLINKNIEPRLNTKKKMDLYEVDANFMIDPLPKKKTKEFTQKEKTEFFAIKKAERIYYNELLLSNKNNDDYKIDFEKIKAEYYYDRKYKDNLILYMKKNLSSDGHKLVNTILSYEKNTSKEDNYFPLISTVSVLLENQLSFILAEKLFPYVQDLVEIMKIERGDRYRTGGLEAWHEGKVYLTLGLIIQLINGARWGIRLKKKRIIDFIKNNFFPPYLDIISDKKLAQTLDMIRLRFRNATCHGKQVVFTEKEYNKLLLLSTGYSTLKNWTDSDISLMPPEQGILHNHMILVKN